MSPRQKWATDRSWIPKVAEEAEILPGKGVRCWAAVSGSAHAMKVLIGTRHLMIEEGVSIPL